MAQAHISQDATGAHPPRSLPAMLTRIVFVLLALLPFFLGTLAAIDHFLDYGRYKTISLLTPLFLFSMLFIALRNCSCRVSEPVLLIGLFAAAVLVRASSQGFFNTQPISDYMDAVNAARTFMQGPARSLETARFPYWGFYRITLATLFRIFGGSIDTIKTFNLLLSGLTAVAIYQLGRQMIPSRRFAVLAALVFIIDPANLLYINMPTGEHIFVLLFPLAMLLMLAVFGQPDRKNAIRFSLAALLGVLVGLMDIYKPIGPVILIAILITLTLTQWSICKAMQEKQRRRKHILLVVLLLAVVLGSYLITKEVCFSIIAYYAQIPPNRYGVGWTLRVGLNIETRGRVSSDLAYYMHSLYAESNENYPAVNEQLIDEALAGLEGKTLATLFQFIRNKFAFTWQSNQDFYNWASNTQIASGVNAYDTERLALLAYPLIDGFLILRLMLSALGAGYCAVKRKDMVTLVVGLFILGFSLLLLIVEVQQRYRSVLASAIPFFAAYALYAFQDAAGRVTAWIRNEESS